MSRSTGTFPSYTRIDLDPEHWPADYWGSSLVCQACETRWPSHDLFKRSPCCDIGTQLDENNAPDMRWPDAIKAHLTRSFEQFYEQYNEGTTDQELSVSDFDFEITEIKEPVAH